MSLYDPPSDPEYCAHECRNCDQPLTKELDGEWVCHNPKCTHSPFFEPPKRAYCVDYRIFFHYEKDGEVHGIGLTPMGIVLNWEALDFHPRARKLMFKRKPFIVIANDEPYFKQAYDLIRYSENLKGTWTDEDEQAYQQAVAPK